MNFKFIILISLLVFAFLNANNAADTIEVKTITTTPDKTATADSSKTCTGLAINLELSEKPTSATPSVVIGVTGPKTATYTATADPTDTTGTKYTYTGITLNSGETLSGITVTVDGTEASLATGVTAPTLECTDSSGGGGDTTTPTITSVTGPTATTGKATIVGSNQFCQGINVIVTYSAVLDDMKSVSPSYTSRPAGADDGNIKVSQTGGTATYTYSLNITSGGDLSDLTFLYNGDTTIDLPKDTVFTFTCTEADPVTTPTTVSKLALGTGTYTAKDGVCTSVEIDFTLDQVGDPTKISISTAGLDSGSIPSITQAVATTPDYVAKFDVKEKSNLEDLVISYDSTPLTLPSTKLTFVCTADGGSGDSKDGSSSDSSLISINVVLILSSLFLYIILFN